MHSQAVDRRHLQTLKGRKPALHFGTEQCTQVRMAVGLEYPTPNFMFSGMRYAPVARLVVLVLRLYAVYAW
jgi:hypothetical protein